MAGLAVAAVAALTGCDPGGLSTAGAAFTTDQTVTAELERRKADVRWLDCTGSYGGGSSPTASEDTVVRVDCGGRTGDGEDIRVTARVTRAVSGACVRGLVIAEIGGRERLRVNGLGDCDATPSPAAPPGAGRPPAPTVTVTVTRTVYCEQRPNCWPEGK
ncbi:lipoprotein [Streptomyces zinciresistens K42]|uniref:Lipoprotein n=1 Tax=Streptomyces zinciresistens K42 TaxID=700597 RepID=G2GJE9_9ACTN|nr:hypothetical protein [Streptomyces zinciresistens]EGX56369.1 lipoprotein [Streptomyces zinciresistens K42]